MGNKYSLRNVQSIGNTYLIIYCMNHSVHYGGCWHSSKLSLVAAFALFPGDTDLDDMTFRCTRCGSTNVDVRAFMPKLAGGVFERWPTIAHRPLMRREPPAWS